MTYQNLISEIKQLTLNERLLLLEAITRSIRDEMSPPRLRGSSVHRVRGLLKPEGPLPDEKKLKDSYTRYLIEKYT
jgi:hypothetical protein